jgi:cysteine-rich repeat protein
VRVEAFLKIWGFNKKFTLWKWKDFWEIASLKKTWYQPGVQADYQDDCHPTVGGVTNHQPGADFVGRYPDTVGNTSFDDTSELLAWCKPMLAANVEDPPAPTVQQLGTGTTDIVNWGKDIGIEVWNAGQLCINGQLWSEFLGNKDGALENANCKYRDPRTGTPYMFPCRDMQDWLLRIWGCLDTNSTAEAVSLATHFNGAGGFNALTTWNATPVFNVNAILVDPTGPFETANVNAAFLAWNNNTGRTWMAQVEACFNARNDPESACACTTAADCNIALGETCAHGACVDAAGDRASCSPVSMDVTEARQCCGDGAQQSFEECDDGNTVDGDGCSWNCKVETPPGPGACCSPTGSCSEVTRAACIGGDALYVPEGSCSSPNTCTDAFAQTGCCCLPAITGAAQSIQLTYTECQLQHGAFAGAGVACTIDVCGPITGACCVGGAGCQVIPHLACNNYSGNYRGDGVTCSLNTCAF